MKFIHMSDLHIGKSINKYSMLDDRKYILRRIVESVKNEKPDAVFISGDVYDRATPSAEAVDVLNTFLNELSDLPIELFMIYGNHDSAERVSFGSELLRKNIHFAKVFDGTMKCVKVAGTNVYMLPFIKPCDVKKAFRADENVENEIGNDYTRAIKYVFEKNNINPDEKNVLLAHQFVSGAQWGGEESENSLVSVGGVDNVSIDTFDAFDYVALGHIHGSQNIDKNGRIRYCGSPLRYSKREKGEKTLSLVTLENGLSIKEIPLVPKRKWRKIEGSYEEIRNMEKSEDFVSISLTDEKRPLNGYEILKNSVFPNIIDFEFKNIEYKNESEINGVENVENKSALELFCEFYREMKNEEIGEKELNYVKDICQKTEDN